MKRFIILTFIFAFFATSYVYAQGRNNDANRREWFKEVRQYKHDFLTKELNLSEDQQDKFFSIYDAMEEEIYNAQHETRSLAWKIRKSESEISDLEYEKAAEAQFELKGKESQIEMKYFPQFKDVLSKKQLFLLKHAEQKFTREIINKHSRMRTNKGGKN